MSIVQEAGWAPGPVWTGAENLAPHRDSIPGPSSPWRVAIPTTLFAAKKHALTVQRFRENSDLVASVMRVLNFKATFLDVSVFNIASVGILCFRKLRFTKQKFYMAIFNRNDKT